MTADIVVRMRVKPRREEDLIDKNKQSDVEAAKELTRIALDKTGGRDYCLVGESDGMDPIAAARPLMISTLDSFRTRWSNWVTGWASRTVSLARSYSRADLRW